MAIPNPNPNIADGLKVDNKTYSSNKIESLVKTATNIINDSTAGSDTVYSSNKVDTLISTAISDKVRSVHKGWSTTLTTDTINSNLVLAIVNSKLYTVNIGTSTMTVSDLVNTPVTGVTATIDGCTFSITDNKLTINANSNKAMRIIY